MFDTGELYLLVVVVVVVKSYLKKISFRQTVWNDSALFFIRIFSYQSTILAVFISPTRRACVFLRPGGMVVASNEDVLVKSSMAKCTCLLSIESFARNVVGKRSVPPQIHRRPSLRVHCACYGPSELAKANMYARTANVFLQTFPYDSTWVIHFEDHHTVSDET